MEAGELLIAQSKFVTLTLLYIINVSSKAMYYGSAK